MHLKAVFSVGKGICNLGQNDGIFAQWTRIVLGFFSGKKGKRSFRSKIVLKFVALAVFFLKTMPSNSDNNIKVFH